jgi:preprotein translocase subunit SecA
MTTHLLRKLIPNFIPNRNQRLLKQLNKTVEKINDLEPEFKKFSDTQLRNKTDQFRQRLNQSAQLDDLLVEAFAAVREMSVRVLGMRHFDVQLIGGIVLHQGKIAEMRTGEGKTLVATLAAYLNALTGNGVHIVTVNDYLAKRDADWMGPLYHALGLTTGVILSHLNTAQRKAAYCADIIYGTNNEFGFDYLRDNMAFNLEDTVQRELNFAIVDEVDSVLIDEARTPLIISGASEDSSELYRLINQLTPQLQPRLEEQGPGDYYLDEKTKQAYLTEAGHQKIEELLVQHGLLPKHENLYQAHNIRLMHHVYAALRAHRLFKRDVDYIVRDDEVMIVDEHTGRVMVGRRWSDGLHQAMEAKEGLTVQTESQTLASITFQNYFRLYHKLSGMTGTADTEAYEFQQIYGLEVVVIPTNQPVRRTDFPDQVYLTVEAKFNAIIKEIQQCHARHQPVLVGTASIENSEYLSNKLKSLHIPHQVLNAKFHEKEAHIISEAGRPGKITIATNMAGRGTDIVLGGNLAAELASLPPETSQEMIEQHKKEWAQRNAQVIAAGGLHIIGSERHESRRIDNQLRGRSGRQGDPGSSRFYLSLQDNLLRIFASDRVALLMTKFGMQADEAIEHPWITRAIENAQRKVEGYHFDVRKELLELDNIANEQRQVIYQQRKELLNSDNISDLIQSLWDDVIYSVVRQHIPEDSMEEQWDVEGLTQKLKNDFACELPIKQWLEDSELTQTDLIEKITEQSKQIYAHKRTQMNAQTVAQIEKSITLQTLDHLWKEHLASMDYLRQSIHLRGYAQKNPKQEFKRESFVLFSELLDHLKYQVISVLSHLEIQPPTEISAAPVVEKVNFSSVSRNAPCPCGSNKKFKHCHGKLT